MTEDVKDERLPDGVMLDDFQRLLDLGRADHSEETPQQGMALFIELAKFIDEHGRRLHLLARIAHQAMERQRKGPPT